MFQLNKIYTILTIIMAVLLVTYIAKSPNFFVKDIKIISGKFINIDQIEAVLNKDKMFHIFFTTKKEIQKILTKEIIQIKRIKINRDFINRRFIISIIEREPFANIISYPRNYVIDEEGIVLNDMEKNNYGEIESLPVITGLDSDKLNENQTRLQKEYADIMKTTLTELHSIFKDQILKYDLMDLQEITLTTKQLFEVKFGDTLNLKKKFNTLENILQHIDDKFNRIVYIDVRFPDYPVVRFLKE